MHVVSPSVEILNVINGEEILKHIEQCGRVCYKSEDKIADKTAEGFVRGIIKRGHESVLEHIDISVKFTCDRGVSHEIVRHRIASYSQESTRYCNYSADKFGNNVTYISPFTCFTDSLQEKGHSWETVDAIVGEWQEACLDAEKHYNKMVQLGAPAELARAVLNNSTKTEIVATMNLREWRHFLRLRSSKAAHPQIRELANELLTKFQALIPVVFDDFEVGE